MQKLIGTYGKTRKVYEAYKKSGYSKKFLEENENAEKAIQLYQETSQKFSELQLLQNLSKIPTIAELQSEYKALAKEKDNIYIDRSTLRSKSTHLQRVKSNICNWLDV